MEGRRVVVVGDKWGVRSPSLRRALQDGGFELLPCSGTPFSGCPPLAGGVCPHAAGGSPGPDAILMMRRRGSFDLSVVCADVLGRPTLVVEEGSERTAVRTTRGARIGGKLGAAASVATLRRILPSPDSARIPDLTRHPRSRAAPS